MSNQQTIIDISDVSGSGGTNEVLITASFTGSTGVVYGCRVNGIPTSSFNPPAFQFAYNSTVGLTYIHDFLLTKKDEGTMLLFPSMLHHSVAPFYNDETRISVSGNIH